VDDPEVEGSAPPQSEGANYFTDVFAANTHSAAIGALADAAIVVGYGDDTYGPRDLTRRDQMASFIMRALDYILEQEVTPTPPPPPAEPGSISGTVFDEEADTAIEGAVVLLETTGDTEATGADGSYSFDPVDPGTHTVTADAEGYDAESQQVDVASGQDVEDVDFELARQAQIESAELTFDSPDTGVVGTGDEWQITFSETMDTDTDGETITLTDGDDSFTVECVEDDTAVVGDNTQALCDWDGDATTLTVTLLEDPIQPEDADPVTFEYPIHIVDTTLTTPWDGSVDIDGSTEGALEIS
jgi:hypothetical protein